MRTGMALIALAVAVMALFGCDAFLAPALGRWNPYDSEATLAQAGASVVVDGWIQGGAWDNAGPSLSTSTNKAILIGFDSTASDIPQVVVGATLYLTTTTSIGPDGDVTAFGILEDWAFGTTDWTQVFAAGVFYDSARSSTTWVESSRGKANEYSWDLTEFIRAHGFEGFHGVMLLGGATDSLFYSQENGTMIPRLVVYGYDP